MRLTFLGTGTSFGIPVIGCHCRVCQSSDPRDRRTRVGALVETDAGARLLIDTPPELRMQLVAADVGHVDAVLYTHDHADHTHGIDDLRALTKRRASQLPLYGSAETLDGLARKFRYIFDDSPPPPGSSKPEAHAHVLEAGVATTIGGVAVTPVGVPHGHVTVFGYRIGTLAYVTDAKALPGAAIDALRGVSVLVVNALFWTQHPTHLSIPEAIAVAHDIGAERTYLTHLTHDNLHADLAAELPRGVMPAYDGLAVDIA